MYVEIVTQSTTNVAVGDQVNSASRDYQKGTCTVEVQGTGVNNPTITVYGKLIQSDDAAVDSGWAELASWTAATANDVSGFPIDILPNMSAAITGNTDSKAVQVAIGYNHRA